MWILCIVCHMKPQQFQNFIQHWMWWVRLAIVPAQWAKAWPLWIEVANRKMAISKNPTMCHCFAGWAWRWGAVVRLDLNNIIQAISWLLSSVQQKGWGVGKRTQFTSSISAARNDLQPLQKWHFYAKANKTYKQINSHNSVVSKCPGDLGSLQGAACD